MSRRIKHHLLKSPALSFPQIPPPLCDIRHSFPTLNSSQKQPGEAAEWGGGAGAHQAVMMPPLSWLADPQSVLQRHWAPSSVSSFSSCSGRAGAGQGCNSAQECKADEWAQQCKCVSTAPQPTPPESSRCFAPVLEHIQLGSFWERGWTACVNLFLVHPWAASASFETGD